MKKITCAALCLALIISLAACSSAEYTVSFDEGSAGAAIEAMTVKGGKKATTESKTPISVQQMSTESTR